MYTYTYNWLLQVEGASPSSPNSFATVAEFTLACSGLRRWNLPCNITQTIATIVTQTPETDGKCITALYARVRVYVDDKCHIHLNISWCGFA